MCDQEEEMPNKKKMLKKNELPDDIRKTTRETINKDLDNSIS